MKMHWFNEIFEGATQAIGSAYFNLPVFGGTSVLRERHYCYELYHQLRSRWPQDEQKILSGEIDKAAHHHLKGLIGSEPIPDFLIHIPDTMTNDTVIEVKSATFSHTGVKKDLVNLSRFTLNAGYERAIFLLFGPDISEDLIEKISKNYNDLLKDGTALGNIEFWIHGDCGEQAIYLRTLAPS
ncbi:hypothetical protein [Serratia sp. JSRIV004]|uniref:hypothetical protein n=1 Tax=Serratia sp. JSRIV004 TaxID=2831895 RepID=UPI001CBC87AB|nr:hypothetical protein [Serratia sp. JSRIV004]UAN59917.1 hypothetical protein KGP21_13055 [Serratia sp. JSRIV004]